MEVQMIGEGKVVIYLKGDDIKELPAAPHDITTAQASRILRSALGATYDQSWERVCFELYPGRDSLLLFALQHSDSPYYFAFSSIEPIISASKACPPGIISYITYIDDGYILIIYPMHGEMPPYALWEYGTALSHPASFSVYLSEHGKVIAGPYALDRMCRTFK